jgi:hypothetical protein
MTESWESGMDCEEVGGLLLVGWPLSGGCRSWRCWCWLVDLPWSSYKELAVVAADVVLETSLAAESGDCGRFAALADSVEVKGFCRVTVASPTPWVGTAKSVALFVERVGWARCRASGCASTVSTPASAKGRALALAAAAASWWSRRGAHGGVKLDEDAEGT